MRYGTGVALVVLAATLWSFGAVGLRLLGEAGAWQVLFWRSVGVLPVLGALVLWRGGGIAAAIRAQGRAGVIGAVGLIAAFGGAIHAIQTLPVANAVFLFSASPFLTAILARIVLGERLRPMAALSIVIAAGGIALMIRGGEFAPAALGGNLAAVGSALGFAIFTVSLRAGGVADTMPTALLGAAFSAVVAAAVVTGTGGALMLGPGQVAGALALGAGLLGVGMALYTFGARVVPAAELTLLSLMEVMLAPVWGWLILGEVPAPNVLAGGGVILAAVILNAATGRGGRPQPA